MVSCMAGIGATYLLRVVASFVLLELRPQGDLLAEQDEEHHDDQLELEECLQCHHEEGQLELDHEHEQHQLDERDQLVDLLLLLSASCGHRATTS